ncbi:MAG: hypothetical protein KDI88_08645 [Gammaproteobacteria bacterium]|nr:hypothetical protein [Gammaproteobacteria bacterium]
MSNTQLVIHGLVYVLPLLLVGVLVARCRHRRRWLTVTLLAALPLFYIGQYHVLQATRGWPSDGPLPATFELAAFRIIEPDARQGERGAILLWVSGAAERTPRAYRLDYSRQLHEDLVEAGQRIEQGRVQVGTRVTEGTARSDGGTGIRFDDRPRAGLPAKPKED